MSRELTPTSARDPAAPDGHVVPELSVYRCRFTFRVDRSGRLPQWTGSTWRGAFGRALKDTVCVTGLSHCSGCPMFERCIHTAIFETSPVPGMGKMRKYKAAPRPYVLLPSGGGHLNRNDLLHLEIRLFGRATRHAALVRAAIERAAARGLGRMRLPLTCIEAADQSSETLRLDRAPAAPQSPVTIRLLSPLRLRASGRLAGPGDLGFGDFFSVLLRRLSMLSTFHQRRPFEVDFRGLVDSARRIRWQDTDLRLQAVRRYSSPQNTRIDMSGLLGRMVLPAESARAFWPWLWMGQSTLVGRGCVMGLGHYRLEPTEQIG